MLGSLVRLSPFGSGEASGKLRRLPHGPEVLAEVRRLIETSHLSYRAIQARSGVPRATISRHVLEQGWLRPSAGMEEPPRSPEAKRRARRGELADLVLRAVEQRVSAVALNPTATPAAFAQAARLLALAQRLDRPGQPRSRVPRAKRLKRAPPERPLPDRPAAR